jgi:hypothetical protein
MTEQKFKNWERGVSGAPVLKAQHPEVVSPMATRFVRFGRLF